MSIDELRSLVENNLVQRRLVRDGNGEKTGDYEDVLQTDALQTILLAVVDALQASATSDRREQR